MSKKLKLLSTVILILTASIILSLILAPIGGLLHRFFWKYQGCWFWGSCDKGAETNGFIYFYIFWLAFFSFFFLEKKVGRKVFIISSFLFWLLAFLFIYIDLGSRNLYESIGSLIIMVCSLTIGWLLAQGGKMVLKKTQKSWIKNLKRLLKSAKKSKA